MKKWWPALVWAIVIAATSSTVIGPKAFTRSVARTVPGVSEDGFSRAWEWIWWLPVKGWHALEFAILSALLVRPVGWRWALVMAIGFAALDEWHQTFVPGRGGVWTDVAIDSLGAAAGIAVTWFRRKRSIPDPQS